MNNEYTYNNTNTSPPGQGEAFASLILGIIAVVCWFFGYSSFLSVVFGVIGLVLASSAKKAGYKGGIRTAGFVLSLIGCVGGLLVFIACVVFVGAFVSILM